MVRSGILAFSLLAAAPALALPTDFAGTGAGGFDWSTYRYVGGGASWNACVGSSGGADNLLAWGGSTTADPVPCPITSGHRPDSTLTIETVEFDAAIGEAGTTAVKVGQLTWFNASTWADKTPDFRIDGALTVDVDQPGVFAFSEELRFRVTNTSNSSDPTADRIRIVSFDGFGLTSPLSLGGGLFLESFSFLLDDGGNGNLVKVEDKDGQYRWINPEHGTSSLHIMANISAVPLPAGAWLLLSGVGGFALLRRRAARAA